MSPDDLVSVVILSWNRQAEIKKTLADLDRQTYTNFEVLVIDQGSSDGTPEAIEKLFPRVRVIRLPGNLGVPGGRNIGVAKAQGDIVVFLDNDASLENEGLTKTVEKFKNNPHLGILGFRILDAKTGELDLGSWVYQKNKIAEAQSEFLTYTYCGAGHAIRKEVFQKAGYYWDELFFSWEEMELSIKAINAGYDILYDPQIVVYHRVSKEKRATNKVHEGLRLRNSLWVLWRYMPWRYSLPMTGVRIFAYLVKAVRNRFLFSMITCLFAAFTRVGLVLNKKDKISGAALERFKALSAKGSLGVQLRWLLLK
jgi:GT2 family glycosyltransferase